jgi:hypothetical protein
LLNDKLKGFDMTIRETRILTDKFDLALRENNIEEAKKLLKDKKTNVSYEDSFAAYYAVEYGRVEIFEEIYKSRRIRIRSLNNDIFISACTGGYFDIVNLFLNKIKINPTLEDNKAIKQTLDFYKEEVQGLVDDKDTIIFCKRLKINKDHKSIEKTMKLLWSNMKIRNSIDPKTRKEIMELTSIMKDKIASF